MSPSIMYSPSNIYSPWLPANLFDGTIADRHLCIYNSYHTRFCEKTEIRLARTELAPSRCLLDCTQYRGYSTHLEGQLGCRVTPAVVLRSDRIHGKLVTRNGNFQWDLARL